MVSNAAHRRLDSLAIEDMGLLQWRLAKRIKRGSRLVREDLGPCDEWTGSSTPGGYGRIRLGRGFYYAHRVAWFLHSRRDPGALCVCHRCDNPRCCNPDHLFLGTYSDNTLDSIAKGRRPKRLVFRNPEATRGKSCRFAKLTESDVREILADASTAPVDLAKRYGVSVDHIKRVIGRRTWRWLQVEPAVRPKRVRAPKPSEPKTRSTGHQILTEVQVREILASPSISRRAFAGRFGVSAATIKDVRCRRTWKWVTL